MKSGFQLRSITQRHTLPAWGLPWVCPTRLPLNPSAGKTMQHWALSPANKAERKLGLGRRRYNVDLCL
jgi:hypothetical protein